MKKQTITLFFLLASVQFFYAQSVRIGPKIGLNVATLTGNVNTEVRSLAALQAGGVVEVELMDWFSIQPELLFSVKGFRINEVRGVNNYVDLPIMAKFYPVDGLYGEIGPQLGFLISANEKNTADRVTVTQDYKTVDIGLGFGAGYVLRDIGLGFGLRYNAGLTNVLRSNSRIRNGVFQVAVTWTFEL